MPPGGGFGGGPAFSMRLDFPKTASVKDYLRTVDFESTELKVHWTDERGEWVRRTFTSRPDNVVVQWLTAPKGQSVNVRITLERSAGGFFGGWRFGGGGLGAPLSDGRSRGRAGFSPRRGRGSTRRIPPGLQRAAADLQGHFRSLGEQQRLRRRDAGGPRRRLRPHGWRHAGGRECVVRDAADAH